MDRKHANPVGVLVIALLLVASSPSPRELHPAFLLTWGWGVQDGSSVFQTCTSGCREGSYGSGIGQFANPKGVAIDAAGNLYVVDSQNDRIQKFDRYGKYLTSWGSSGSDEGQFGVPIGVALDALGNVYVADKANHRIQKFDNTGTFLLTWGWGVQNGSPVLQTCVANCQAGSAGGNVGQFDDPTYLAIDVSGVVYVADTDNHRIQKFESTGVFLDLWGAFGSGDEEFKYPMGIAIDSKDNAYVADSENYRIVKYNIDGIFLDKWGSQGILPGELNSPVGVAVDRKGDVYVSDQVNYRMQKFSPRGELLSVWGKDGTAGGEFDYPDGVAVDALGFIYVADYANRRIQKFGGPWLEYYVGELLPSRER